MTTDRDEAAWSTHEVPTFTQAEDTWIAGLTARQLLGLMIAATLGYVVYQFSPLWFLPLLARIAVGVAVGLLIAGFVAIKPGGRTMFVVIGEYVAFRFGPRYHVSAVSHLVASRPLEQYRRRRRRRALSFSMPLPLPGRIVRLDVRIPLPFWRGRSGEAAMLLLLLSVGVFAAGCGADKAQAQVADDYRGRRVYLQSIVVNLGDNISEGGQSATIRLKAAAPLKEAGPRLNETLQSVTELTSHGTRVLPAWTKVGAEGAIPSLQALGVGQEFVFENIFLGDPGSRLLASGQSVRPYCDIAMGEGVYVNRGSSPRVSYRAHSQDCRIRAQGSGDPDAYAGLAARDAISKPVLSVNWQDRKRNQGALSIGVGMLPYPRQSVVSVDPVEEITDGDVVLLDRHEICNGNLIKIVALGIQSERPADPGLDDYFEGESGQRIVGEVQTCPMLAPENVEVILPETVVFAGGESDYEIKVRPVVSTIVPQDIVNSARLSVVDKFNEEIVGVDVPVPGDEDFDPLNPNTVKFNIAPPALEDKRNSTDPDSAIIQLRVDLDHRVTVKRPVYQPIEQFDEHGVQHIYTCGCSKSGGTCSPGGGSCSCSCSSNHTRRYFKYWDPHYRVDAEDREYLPDSDDSNVELVFEQSFLFEKMLVTFDRPYEELVYVDPTPEPGEVREPDYHEEGRVVGLWDGEPLHCGPGVAQDTEGRWTGWLWVEPGTNSKGEAYGGCRRAFACKLKIPEQEEPFGPGGMPTEEDYECINK